MPRILAIDQGTTGTKAFIYDDEGKFSSVAAFSHRQIYPQPGWVEHDPEELLNHVQQSIDSAKETDAIGIDNQGETVVAWDARTKRPIYNAIVWQDDRTRNIAEKLKADGGEALTLERAGLPLDCYFSASKLRWIIDHVADATQLLKEKRLRLGTSDAFFLDRLTGCFATDPTTASRTSLMSLDTLSWDEDLCHLFGVPMECLPTISPTTGCFGEIGRTLVTASIVDQQAALFGHGCVKPGDMKITFGTGAFALAVAKDVRGTQNEGQIISSIAWQIGNAKAEYALEGGVYCAASAVNWCKQLGLFSSYGEIGAFSGSSAIERGLVFVPAFAGLGCPYWDRTAAGLWMGLGLDTTRSMMMQSVLEGIALRASEVVAAMDKVMNVAATISVDGGLVNNPYFVQFLAKATGRTVAVPSSTELTGLGTARMALLGLNGGKSDKLPQLPPLKSKVAPEQVLSVEHAQRFRNAVERARNWKV
jgi:glycerol kinase